MYAILHIALQHMELVMVNVHHIAIGVLLIVIVIVRAPLVMEINVAVTDMVVLVIPHNVIHSLHVAVIREYVHHKIELVLANLVNVIPIVLVVHVMDHNVVVMDMLVPVILENVTLIVLQYVALCVQTIAYLMVFINI